MSDLTLSNASAKDANWTSVLSRLASLEARMIRLELRVATDISENISTVNESQSKEN